MYLLKARERLPEVEREEARERRRHDLGIPDLHIVQQHGLDKEEADRIPDKGAKMKCKYIGSFRVHPPEGLTGRSLQSAIGGFISEVIRNINPKRVRDTLSIALHINRHGVKIFKSKKLFMAYPLRRVINCQMSPNPPLFGMVCKDVPDGTSIHFCHVFLLSSPEEASELNQLMSHAFKVAFAHNNLRNSLERPSASAKSTSKGSKPKKTPSSSSSSQQRQQQQQERQQQQQLPSYDSLATPSVVPNAPSYETLLDEDLPSYDSLAAASYPVAAAGAIETTPLQGRRSGSISGAHVTAESLQEEVRRLQQKVNETEDRLNSISPEDDAVFELTLDLSSFEEQLKIKQQQLETLLLMAPTDDEQSYSSGGAVGEEDRSYEDQQLLQDAEWYQAALPREFVMTYLMEEPVGSFIVRDSASNPGCLAISVKIPDGSILHYLIVRDEKGWYLQGSDRHHPNLTSLILYHGSTIDHIPCCLALGATNQLSDTLQTDGPEGDEEISDEEMIRQLAQLSVLHPI